jgi:anion-transporting  ArsA/GET3 family ATPase
MRAVSVATQTLLRAVSKVAGSEMVEDAIAFFQAFEGMEQGFRERAASVERLLSDPGTAFVLVASPRRDSIEEASHFAAKLAESSIPVQALVVNRLQPSFGAVSGPGAPDPPQGEDPQGTNAPGAYTQLTRNLADFRAVAAREEGYFAELAASVAPAPVARVPILSDDVHDLSGLSAVVRHLVGDPVAFDRGHDPDRQ